MADRKPTVLSTTGFLENLQSADNLVIDKAPVNDNHAVNKQYVDNNNEIQNLQSVTDVGNNTTNDIELGEPELGITKQGVKLEAGGAIEVYGSDSSANTKAISVINSSDATVSYLNNDGSASFATVQSGEYASGVQGCKLHNGYVEATNTSANYNVFLGELNGSETSTIKAGGSAEFAGELKVDDNVRVGMPTQNPGAGKTGTIINPDIGIMITSENTPVFQGYGLSTGSPTSSISHDGSATFVGGLTKLTGGGSLFLESTAADEGVYIGKNGPGDWNIVLDGSDGSASFDGHLEAASIDGGTF